MLFTVYIFHGTKTGARINLEKNRFLKLNVRSSYYDLLNVYFHVIQKLCKGVFVFDFVVKFTKNDLIYCVASRRLLRGSLHTMLLTDSGLFITTLLPLESLNTTS